MIIYFIVALLLIAVDQITKYLTVSYLKPIGNIDLIPNIFSLTYVENKGAAFGMMQDARWFFICLTIIILAVLTIYIIRKKPQGKLLRISFALIYSGAIGNLIDRLFSGYVVDMIRVHFFDFPVFNFADCSVVIGTILLCLLIIKEN